MNRHKCLTLALPRSEVYLHFGKYLLALTLATCASELEHPHWQCNKNFVCDPDENQVSCPDDCVWSEATAEGPRADVCDAQENWTFVAACRETCGNGQKDDGETRSLSMTLRHGAGHV